MMLLHRLLLQPPPSISLGLLKKPLPLPFQTASTFFSSFFFPPSSTRSLCISSRSSIPSRSCFYARFSSEAVLEIRKDVRTDYDDETGNEDGNIEAEREECDFGGLIRVLDKNTGTGSRTNNKLKHKLPNLSVKEKKELASYAHSLGKKLKSQQVGKSGVTDTVVMALIEALEANELLKLKIHNNCPGELDDVVKQLEEGTGSVVVGRIGRTVILYRPSMTKLKVEEKKNQARRFLVKKQPTLRQFQSNNQPPRQSGRGLRGSSRSSG